jgi:iron uptake system EfeUOB component EfeO/EfeM
MAATPHRVPFSVVAVALNIGAICLAVTVAAPAWADSIDKEIENYRTQLIADIDSTLADVEMLRARAAAGDVEEAKRAWIEARIGWERSEVFTGAFVPELDEKIDAWPNGTMGFHAIEARLFGANRTDLGTETNELSRNVTELRARAADTSLTAQGLLNGIVQLVYEVGDSKVDGGESRISGTSLYDMRNNVDGIAFAYDTIFAAALAARDRDLDAEMRRSIGGLKAMVAIPDLRRVDADALRTATEELVLKLQNAAPLLGLREATLEASMK